eukprot:CAMPEP_0180810236 /NCGR_PEP_ID=MMETSP1038_2-20121128/64770_1 /TAXON_ID=632150 /ORGANISM="Azadinium spinosum, Strain 3D9" /LENGTH=84 /DNA_ID=CAMNT_0022851499 /DNA_START=425 /DNA_END=675 /DNA_ORIENTATION=-
MAIQSAMQNQPLHPGSKLCGIFHRMAEPKNGTCDGRPVDDLPMVFPDLHREATTCGCMPTARLDSSGCRTSDSSAQECSSRATT